jgi:hypothetical protein
LTPILAGTAIAAPGWRALMAAAVFRQTLGDGAPDAAGRPGYDRRFAGQVKKSHIRSSLIA